MKSQDEFEKMQVAFEETFPNLSKDKHPSGKYVAVKTQYVWEGYRAASEQINAVIPDGYKVAYDTVEERVKKVVEGAKLFQGEIENLKKEISALEALKNCGGDLFPG